MAHRAEPLPARRLGIVRPARINLGRDFGLGYALLSPALVYMLALVGYPFVLALWFSLSNTSISGDEAHFVGLRNYIGLMGDSVFRSSLKNSLMFVFVAEIFKTLLGIGLGFVMLPWTIPVSLSLLGWKWMFDPQFSVINYTGAHLGILHSPLPDWLGQTQYAIAAILTVNIWRGF